MGTDPEKSDLFPQMQVGYNSSGKLEVSPDGVHINGQSYGKMTEVRQKRSTAGGLLMEPGRQVLSFLTY